MAVVLAGCAGGARVPGDPSKVAPADPLSADIALSAPQEGMARVVFYRPEEAFLVAVKPRIVVNGKSAGAIAMGTAFYRDAVPGFYNVHLEHEDDDAVIVQAKAGDVVFLRTRLAWAFLGYELRVEEVKPETGLAEARILRWEMDGAEGAPLSYRRDLSPAAAD